MPLEIEADLRKYCVLTDDGECVDRFVCPVEGCRFSTRLGAGALRMHILLKSDPGIVARYCEKHEQFYNLHRNELGLDRIRYLAELPQTELESN